MKALYLLGAAATAAAMTVTGTLATGAFADERQAYGDVSAVELPMASPSADVVGRPLAYPPGTPAVRAYRITIAPGKATALHAHEVPLFAYVESGALEVDYGTKGKRRYKAGDAFMEAVEWCHAGRAVGDGPAVLIAAYLGGGGLKNTVDCPR